MGITELLLVLICVNFSFTFSEHQKVEDEFMHTHQHTAIKRSVYVSPPGEENADFWNDNAQAMLRDSLSNRPIEGRAKNVILFLGDGMSIPTLGAARVYQGQQTKTSGEETYLSFEKFPYVGLSKTYCVDHQVADSACTATAYLGGVKANLGTIGVTASVPRYDCIAMQNKTHHVSSIASWAQQANKSTGLVTTTRVTHASPAGVYSHTANRDWENDADVVKDKQNPLECLDIATQMVYGETGSNLNVIFGGGRKNFLPNDTVDDEGQNGTRADGRNLIEEWKNTKKARGKCAKYIWNREQLKNASDFDNVLGLFESNHCSYHLDANEETEPTLTEMMAAAISILEKNPNGYFLFVEGGRIDHAHHDTNAQYALDETIQFSEAIQEATRLTNPEETLIVVTSDHAHTMSYGGYPSRGNDILGKAGVSDIDELPYSTLSYANGPGYKHPSDTGARYDISHDPMGSKDYMFPSLAPLKSETHGGDDVGIFALGPWAHLLVGVKEQNLIPHVMAFSSCIGNGLTACDNI